MYIHPLIKDYLSLPTLKNGDGSQVIQRILEKPEAAMIARFGAVEIKGVIYSKLPWPLRQLFRKKVFSTMKINAGFFSIDEQSIDAFSKMMVEDMRQLDVLASWRIEERALCGYFKEATKVELRCMEPYLSAEPWSQALEGKKVLVVHPFSKSIEHQYFEKRELLFSDRRILPKFKSLQTVKAVQSVAGNNAGFQTWFDALRFMQKEIDNCDYDIAILGCGAYGFPLAAHIKRSGKKAIHMGGPTQILFGIKGLRWDNHPIISKFYNEQWIRPIHDDVPVGAKLVEGGCYW